MDKELKITDRQVANIREDLSRIHRQAYLISNGTIKTKNGENRLDIIRELASKIDEIMKGL